MHLPCQSKLCANTGAWRGGGGRAGLHCSPGACCIEPGTDADGILYAVCACSQPPHAEHSAAANGLVQVSLHLATTPPTCSSSQADLHTLAC
jgi:hypothetical protein